MFVCGLFHFCSCFLDNHYLYALLLVSSFQAATPSGTILVGTCAYPSFYSNAHKLAKCSEVQAKELHHRMTGSAEGRTTSSRGRSAGREHYTELHAPFSSYVSGAEGVDAASELVCILRVLRWDFDVCSRLPT